MSERFRPAEPQVFRTAEALDRAAILTEPLPAAGEKRCDPAVDGRRRRGDDERRGRGGELHQAGVEDRRGGARGVAQCPDDAGPTGAVEPAPQVAIG